jgi:archaellin
MLGDGGRRRARDGRAQVGIESLVVFVALIIVAMLAVTVLLGTTGSLQNAASITGEQSTDKVVQRVSVFSVQERDTRIVEEYTLGSRNVSVENRTTTLSNGGTSLSSDWDAQLTAAVDGEGNVTLEADGETITVRDGDVLGGISHSPGADTVGLKNVNTSESLPGVSTISVVDDGDPGTENLTLSYDGSSVTAAEGESYSVTATVTQFETFNGDLVTANVTGGDGSVTISDGADSLTVADDHDLRFYHGNGTVRNADTGASVSVVEFAVVDDGDGATETLDLSYGGTTVSLTEGSPFRVDPSPRADNLKEASGTARTVEVSSGGNVTLSDGSGTLELTDGDDLEVTTPEPGVFELTNVATDATLRTDADTVTLVDDGDADSGEVLRIGRVAAKEGLSNQLRLGQFSSRESTDSGVYTVTVGTGPGSDSVDLAEATVAVVGPTNATTLTYAGGGAPETRETFVVVPIKDEGDTAPVLTDDADRFKIRFDAGSVPDDAELTVRITTASGATRVIVIDGEGYRG